MYIDLSEVCWMHLTRTTLGIASAVNGAEAAEVCDVLRRELD